MLCITGPYIDQMITNKWIGFWEANVPALEVRGCKVEERVKREASLNQ
jgi:hypothetical protein